MSPSPTRSRPPFDGDERTQLLGWLDLQRAIVHYKCEGLSDEDAHRSVLESSPMVTVAGVVSHLRWVEHTWFEVAMLGGPTNSPPFDDTDEDLDFRMAVGRPLAVLLDEYSQQCARSSEIVAAHDLGDRGRQRAFASGTASLRWILVHMIEETARHAGHLDLLREQLDGVTGYDGR